MINILTDRHLRLHALLPDEQLPLAALQQLPTITEQELLQAAHTLLHNVRLHMLVQVSCTCFYVPNYFDNYVY